MSHPQEFIYALFHHVDFKKVYFYVGRSARAKGIRHDEHIHAANGERKQEDVYKYIREHVAYRIFFEDVLCYCKDENPNDYEDFYVVKLLREGAPLQNMKKGDMKKLAELTAISNSTCKIATVSEFKVARAKHRATQRDTHFLKGTNMATSLAAIRAKLASTAYTPNIKQSYPPNAIYPHWLIETGTSATIRLLPDNNADNPYFWVERNLINLPFSGVKGYTNSRPVVVKIPCMETWGETCPILTEVRKWFKDPAKEAEARKYWKKRAYFFQGFVRNDPLSENTSPENPIRRFVISPQIFGLIKNALIDPDFDIMPTDYDAGLDFRINKTSKGEFADYSTSTWTRRVSPLTDTEKLAIDENGLFDLSSFLPTQPNAEEIGIMVDMFHDSAAGMPYDEDKWGDYFKYVGMETDKF